MPTIEHPTNRSWVTLQETFAILGVPASRLRKKEYRNRLGLEDHPRPRECMDLRMTFVTRASISVAKGRLDTLAALRKTK